MKNCIYSQLERSGGSNLGPDMKISNFQFFFLKIRSWGYKQFPGIRGELQGGVLDGFDLFFGKFSVNFPDEFSVKNGKQILINLLKAFTIL